jgi:Ni/Co efflux regulator RcnB
MKARTTTFKVSAAVCAVLAGTLGFGSLASAQDWGDRRGGDRAEQRHEQRHERRDQGGRRDHDGRHDQHGRRDSWRGDHHQQPRFVAQPNHRWNHDQQAWRGQPRFSRGAYLPYQYRNRAYYVNDWRAYNGLYAPPHGQQWVNVDGQFLLVALTSGLIANALLN